MKRRSSWQTVFVSSLTLVVGLSLLPRAARALGESEDEIFQQDLREARTRAKDFNAQKLREATEDLQRQQGAKEVKKERTEFENFIEHQRQTYIRDRNARPSEWREQARLERADDEKKLAEDKQMEKNRRDYKKKRQRVLRLIETEAHIDENQEYGL